MKLVEMHIIKRSHTHFVECDSLCFASKNLYNKANYIIRQEFINTSKEKKAGIRTHAIYLNYHDIRKKLFDSEEYRSLPQKVSNQTLMIIDKNWKSFFRSIKDYAKNPSKYLGRPKLPKYLNVEKGRFVVIYEKGAISIRGLKKGFINLSGTNISIPTKQTMDNVCQARIVSRNGFYAIEVVYEKEESKMPNSDVIAALDSGVNNLATVALNKRDKTPFIISGKPLKSINQFYNKKKANMQSKLEKEQNKKTSNNINKITNKRNEKIKDYMHKASCLLVNQLAENNVSTLIIGKNTNQKQDSNIGKKNNQNFVGIPTFRFLDMVAYKAKLKGINVVWQEESFTSKACFQSGDHIPVYGDKNENEQYVFSGYRQHRGLYKVKDQNKCINADLNAALNILKKAIPNAFANGIEGFAVNPKRLTIRLKPKNL